MMETEIYVLAGTKRVKQTVQSVVVEPKESE